MKAKNTCLRCRRKMRTNALLAREPGISVESREIHLKGAQAYRDCCFCHRPAPLIGGAR